MRTIKLIIAILVVGQLLISCKNDTVGDLRVINESNEMIWVKFSDNGTDTVIGQIESQSSFVIKIFDVKGNPRRFNCCPCETKVFYIYRASGKIQRDISSAANWSTPGREKMSLTGSDQIHCEFVVKQEDL